MFANNKVIAWKFKGLSGESIKRPATLNYSLNSRLDYFDNPKFWVEFNGTYIKPDKVSFALIK